MIVMSTAVAKASLKFHPYKCRLCGTANMNHPKHILEHMNTPQHRSACASINVDLDCTSPDGSSCLTKKVKAYLFPRIVSQSVVVPALVDTLDISSARLSSDLSPRELSALCNHVEDLAQTLNVADVSSLLSKHGFNDTAWLHLEDNMARVKALCVHIMRTNNTDLFQELGLYFERRRQEYEEMCHVFHDVVPSGGATETSVSSNDQECSANEVNLLRAKMEQMSSELEHYRQLQLNAASATSSFEEQRSVSSKLICQEISSLAADQNHLIRQEMSSLAAEHKMIRQEMSNLLSEQKKLIQEQTLTLKKEMTNKQDDVNYLKHLEHYAELILKGTDDKIVNATYWLPLWPSMNGVYPTVNWEVLDGKRGRIASVWREMKANNRPGTIRKLFGPQLRLSPSLCHGVPLAAMNLYLQSQDSSLTLYGTPLADQNRRQHFASVHIKARLSLPTTNGNYQVLRRDALVTLATGQECELIQFGVVVWNSISSEWLPQLSVTLLPVDPVDEDWWFCGMPPVKADAAGVYPRVDWSFLGGDSDWVNIWKRMIVTTEIDENTVCFADTLVLPPMYLPGGSRRVVRMCLSRRQLNCIGICVFYHHDLCEKNQPLLTNTFQVQVELNLRMRNCAQIKKLLKAETVSISSSGNNTSGGVFLTVTDWNMLDPEVPPSVSITITDVK